MTKPGEREIWEVRFEMKYCQICGIVPQGATHLTGWAARILSLLPTIKDLAEILQKETNVRFSFLISFLTFPTFLVFTFSVCHHQSLILHKPYLLIFISQLVTVYQAGTFTTGVENQESSAMLGKFIRQIVLAKLGKFIYRIIWKN